MSDPNERILRKHGVTADPEAVARAAKDRPRLAEIEKCKKSSWYLATEVLDYGWNPKLMKGLSLRLDKPIMDWYDKHRDDPFVGIWMRRKLGHKTTRVIVWIIQNWLIDPTMNQGYFHAVDEQASDVCREIAHHIRYNKKLRALDPIGKDRDGKSYKIWPDGRNTRAFKTDRIELKRTNVRHARGPSLMCKGAGSEVTGAHFDGPVWLDDIIARKTIENSELQKIERWVQSTIVAVSDLIFRSTGTPWSELSIHQKWMKDPQWVTLIIPGSVSATDDEIRALLASDDKKIVFAPCYKFTNPVFWPVECAVEARKRLKIEQTQMRGDFAPQIMCDSEPEAERPWIVSAEQICTVKPTDKMPGAYTGKGTIVVKSDPAPWLAGSYKGLGEKQRGDGTKDEWAIDCWRVRVRGELVEYVMLDGSASFEWSEDQGCDVAAGMMKKWRTNLFVSEDPDAWHEKMLLATRRAAVSLRRAKNGGPLKYAIYNKADRKRTAMSAFCAAERDGLVYFCDTVPKEYLSGDEEHTGLLTQGRKYRRVENRQGHNLRFDDRLDLASRILDPLFAEIGPRIQPPPQETDFPWSPFHKPETDNFSSGSRYVRW